MTDAETAVTVTVNGTSVTRQPERHLRDHRHPHPGDRRHDHRRCPGSGRQPRPGSAPCRAPAALRYARHPASGLAGGAIGRRPGWHRVARDHRDRERHPGDRGRRRLDAPGLRPRGRRQPRRSPWSRRAAVHRTGPVTLTVDTPPPIYRHRHPSQSPTTTEATVTVAGPVADAHLAGVVGPGQRRPVWHSGHARRRAVHRRRRPAGHGRQPDHGDRHRSARARNSRQHLGDARAQRHRAAGGDDHPAGTVRRTLACRRASRSPSAAPTRTRPPATGQGGQPQPVVLRGAARRRQRRSRFRPSWPPTARLDRHGCGPGERRRHRDDHGHRERRPGPHLELLAQLPGRRGAADPPAHPGRRAVPRPGGGRRSSRRDAADAAGPCGLGARHGHRRADHATAPTPTLTLDGAPYLPGTPIDGEGPAPARRARHRLRGSPGGGPRPASASTSATRSSPSPRPRWPAAPASRPGRP